MERLEHNGILIPKYEAKGFHIFLKGKKIDLTSDQEEMAVAWVKKLDTIYARDRRFVSNFFGDFCRALGLKEKVKPEDFDFSEIKRYLDEERERKLKLTPEEKKTQAQARKTQKEANKEKYGYAIVDGARVELANYMAEPSCIFMGRGKHPLRGRWKRGPSERDIILNLSPDAPMPPGEWKERVWEPNFMWIAKWTDNLSGKEKYVWLADSSHLKQAREIEKFNKARELEGNINALREYIWRNLNSEDLKRRKAATVCYLIDELKLRVGDEKDKDEADTVGATTLRPEHIHFESNGTVNFDFLGKDSVRWCRSVSLPTPVIENLKEFSSTAKSSIFAGINSKVISSFLGEVMPGLTAKVFRTYHASKIVEEYLKTSKVSWADPDYCKKYVATMANLQAAISCNHKRKLPKNWRSSLAKQKERLRRLRVQKKRTAKAKERLEALRIKIKTMEATRDYNLRTSLKSYIDPRVYYTWGKEVNYDWKQYYPKVLQRKFSWVEGTAAPLSAGGDVDKLTVTSSPPRSF
ncbi:MAG: DNA topoisomerase I [Candidatus Bathyarchaeia archaeon]